MIQPNELRIGNWVQIMYPDLKTIEWNRVAAISATYIEVIDLPDLYKRPLVNCDPIPLTPEVLEKCGFTIDDGDYWEFEGFKIWGDTIDDKCQCYHINSELLINFDYLHQLQNIFFAATKEELIYKP